MAKLGSGSKGSTKQKLPKPVGKIEDDPSRPWVDDARWKQQQAVAGSARALSSALKSSKSTGIKP
jgi:hypothetical protein